MGKNIWSCSVIHKRNTPSHGDLTAVAKVSSFLIFYTRTLFFPTFPLSVEHLPKCSCDTA